MAQPAVWDADPQCGHQVACAFQTHYCTYVRVPRLLTLQAPQAPDELLLLVSLQWHELWLEVLLTDLRAALADDGTTYEPVKLLRRGIEILKLFDAHADFAETVLVREGSATKRLLPPPSGGTGAPADRLSELLLMARRLPRLQQLPYPGLAEAAREYSERLRALRVRHRRFLRRTLVPDPSAEHTYAGWLHLPDLLSLQNGPKAAWHEPAEEPAALMEPEPISPDERMFIIVHQCFELWFRVVLDQLDHAVAALLGNDVAAATRCVQRVALVQRWLVEQIRIPATMLPLDFLRFRSQEKEEGGRRLVTGLSPASGTESYQFREIEILCGLRDDATYRDYLAGTEKLPVRLLTPRHAERLRQPTVMDAFRQAVRARGVARFDDLFTPADAPNPHADLARLADLLLDFDEAFGFWRLAHVGMVQKMIGGRSGTGFLGPEYLMETAGLKVQEHGRVLPAPQVRPRFFPELWDVRTRLGQV